jgi:hypothetical protein
MMFSGIRACWLPVGQTNLSLAPKILAVTVLAKAALYGWFIQVSPIVEVFALFATSQKETQFSLHISHLEVLLSAATLPILLAITGVRVVGSQMSLLEANSPEVFRGKRLPLLPFPSTEN